MTNSIKTFTFVAFSILAIALLAGFASAQTTILSDDFEDGNLNGWIIANLPTTLPNVDGAWTNTGSFAVASPGNSSDVGTTTLEVVVNTQNFENIAVSYDRRLVGTFEASDHFIFSYSLNGGTTYVDLEDSSTGEDVDFVSQSFNLPAGADDLSNLRLRFTCVNNALSESCRLDNFLVEGTAMSGSSGPSLTIVKVQELTKSQNGVIRVENDGDTALSSISLTSTGGFAVNLNPDGLFNLGVGDTRTITVSSTELDDLNFGDNTVTLTATASGGVSATSQFTVEGTFCSAGSVGGDLVINNIDINNEGEGDDDEWKLLDTIEVEVEVENEGDEDIDDVFVEIGLFDSTGDNMINDVEFDNADEEEVDLGEINDGDEETVTFTFRIPADMDDGNYRLAVKVYSDDLGEDEECSDESGDLSDDLFESVSIDREDDEGKFIAFEDVVLTPSQAQCGDLVSLRTEVFNIGDEDQEQVRINLRSPELGVDESFEIRSDLDEGDSEDIRIDFQVPSDAEDGSYAVELTSQYDYSRGNYRESSDDSTRIIMQVIGCSPSTGGPNTGGNMAAVNAFLDSNAVGGEELVVRTTITNLQNSDVTFILGAEGYQSWAALEDVSDRILDLGAGESQEVTFTFLVDEDASGQESFDIEIRNGDQIETKEVAVNINAASTTGGTSFDLGDNAFLWIIGLVNVILIVLIIVVAVRISRR